MPQCPLRTPHCTGGHGPTNEDRRGQSGRYQGLSRDSNPAVGSVPNEDFQVPRGALPGWTAQRHKADQPYNAKRFIF